MSKRKIFVSFDFENDRNYKYLLEAWNSNDDFEFEFDDKSTREINSWNIYTIKAALTRKTNEADYTIYINENQLNMKQIQFVKLLIDYVIKNGTIDMIALTEDPFRALGEVGDLFEDKVNIFMQIRKDIESINKNAKKLA